VWVKPQRIAGKLRQLARVTWASGAGGLPRMISVGRMSILREASPRDGVGTVSEKTAPGRYRTLSRSGNILLDTGDGHASLALGPCRTLPPNFEILS